uniref:Uncharacterized protein n=1 Tax=Rhizochromulina marina TaxID=1034831 RepID=A0A7S2S5E5_9STRA|mmetsp:Transcript_25114/g.73384  ORF Transcript_25114/g.73384 Transcript_25114/m.73384 type:complete len:347 (+) Transcript_25114:205-1245(+)
MEPPAGESFELPSETWLGFLQDRAPSSGGAGAQSVPACTPCDSQPPFSMDADSVYRGYSEVTRKGLLPAYTLYLHAKRAGLDPRVALGRPDCISRHEYGVHWMQRPPPPPLERRHRGSRKGKEDEQRGEAVEEDDEESSDIVLDSEEVQARAHSIQWSKKASINMTDRVPLAARQCPQLVHELACHDQLLQNKHVENRLVHVLEGHVCLPDTRGDGAEIVTAERRLVDKMKASFPALYSGPAEFYRRNEKEEVQRPGPGHQPGQDEELRFQTLQVQRGSCGLATGSWGAHQASGGFNLPTRSRVPIVRFEEDDGSSFARSHMGPGAASSTTSKSSSSSTSSRPKRS